MSAAGGAMLRLLITSVECQHHKLVAAISSWVLSWRQIQTSAADAADAANMHHLFQLAYIRDESMQTKYQAK